LNTNHIIVAVIVLQQGVVAGVWLLLAWLGMARRACLQWGMATLALAAGMAVVLLRPQLPPVVGDAVPNVLNIAGFVLVLRGMRLFARQPPRDGELLAMLLVPCAGVLAAAVLELGRNWVVVAAAGGMAWPVLRSVGTVLFGLRDEFGRRAALLLTAPLVIVGALLLVRVGAALLALARGETTGQSLLSAGTPQLGIVFVFLAMGLVLNFGFGGMVVLRLVNRLRHLSLHDVLTGLLNRRGLEQRLAHERERQRRHGTPMALLSVDVDHFKRVNDQHGHAAGDAVLVGVARLLQREARSLDVVARMGGEEFCLLLPATGRDGAWQLAQRLLRAHREHTHEVGGSTVTVTISIGLALAEDPREPDADLWRRVDAALYRAKSAGRDRAEVAPAAPPPSTLSAPL
jgi:diguanylate cyclase (GGDEF)-like protein